MLLMSLLSGAITMPNGSALPASKIAKFSKHEWQARRWEWVDPKSDMEAKILSVRAGLMAPQHMQQLSVGHAPDTRGRIDRGGDEQRAVA